MPLVATPDQDDRFAKEYAQVDKFSRQLLQLCAVSNVPKDRDELTSLANELGMTDGTGKPFGKMTVKQIMESLVARYLLIPAPYKSVTIHPAIQDLVVQDSVRDEWFSKISDVVAKQRSRYYECNYAARDLRIAFYRGDVAQVRPNLIGKQRDPRVKLLDPFSRDIFDRLDPILRQLYLADLVPRIIFNPKGSPEFLTLFDELSEGEETLESDFLAAWLDLAIARGDLESLDRLDRLTNRKFYEVSGCIALLRGDWEKAEACIESVLPGGKRKSNLAAVCHLPALFYLLLLFKKGDTEALAKARAIESVATKARKGCYDAALSVIGEAIVFRESPSSPEKFATQLASRRGSSLTTLLVGYFANWLLTDEDTSFQVDGLVQAGIDYRTAGLHWLAAEASGLAGKTNLKTAREENARHVEAQAKLGTASLVNLIKSEPVWMRSLSAIAELGDATVRVSQTGQTSQACERLIFEWNHKYGPGALEVFEQKYKGGEWSKGRKIALQRLYERHKDPEFAYLTEQDRALCRALESSTFRGNYGYMETNCSFDNVRAARALIGHPRIFPVGQRDNPIEIVDQQPRMVVCQEDEGRISLTLDPKIERDDEELRLVVESPHRIAIVFFNDQHRKLHKILGGKLTVPAAAASKVIESIQRVASLVSVHSEIGHMETGTSKSRGSAVSVEGNPQPHIHLLPYQAGLRVEFFVQPFGAEGPFCRPGEGAENIYANLGNTPKTAKRDLNAERGSLAEVIAACPALAASADSESSICFPSPIEALEALIELEELASSHGIALHWPQGRSLNLAGRASADQFHVNIRKDHDWFAATGNLKVDKSLTLDMLQLIHLVQASPSRFVKLDDGRFLALTEQLKQRIDELAAYGDRRSKGKLRFSRLHAVVLEELGGSVNVKSDSHWKEWIERMRTATEVCPDVPSTLQTELRDYQREGFQWLARLAEWGVGGCLADDMGLGKTIQALALLLHRAAGGPALIVAPTSVAFNWLSEIQRFAPTLNARLFNDGSRDAMLKNLGPRDLLICSYGLLHTEAERLQAQSWHTIILDEAQAIKNMATQRSQAAMGLQADFRLILTGTPLENHLGELWNLLEFINPGLLGSLESFQSRFALPIERDQCRDARRRLKKLIQPFILRRTKSQVLQELPSRTEVILQVELSEEEAAFYEALRQSALEKLANVQQGPGQHMQILAEIMRLRRACCHPRLVLEDCGISGSKLALFSKTIDELLVNKHKVLVFSQFVGHLSILREELDRKGVSYQYLDGSSPAKQRKQSVEAFQAGQGDVFLISLKAGGLGLNLTAADYVIHMDPWWNPAVEDQASDRAHRLGQQRPVTIYRLITQGTIEERINALHASKRDLADSLLEGADISAKLSAEELLKMIRE